MKKYAFVVSAVCLMAAGNLNLKAEEGHKPSADERKARMERRFEELSQRLELTEDQKTLMKSQWKSTREQMRSIHNDSSLSKEEKREKMKALRQSQGESFAAFLTEDQKNKMKQIREEHKNHRMEMMKKRDGCKEKHADKEVPES